MRIPRLSIITPSYNQGQFLEQTIRSVLSQGYPNLEYIVMDGGSTDSSLEIIQRYADKFSYWTSQPDNGQAEAINEGFRFATGKYIAWINSDDLYLPGCLQKAVDALEANPTAVMAFGQVEVINEQGKKIAMFRPVTYIFNDLLTYKTIVPQQAAVFRRSMLAETGVLNTNLHFALDHEFFLRIGERYPVISLPDVMAQYRLSKINKGTIQRSSWAAEFVQIVDHFFREPAAQEKYAALQAQAYAGAHYKGAGILLDDGFYAQARQWYRIAAQYHPDFLLKIRWWVGFLRTFVGKSGNIFYLDLKFWLAKRRLLDIRYDWWTALRISEEQNKTQT